MILNSVFDVLIAVARPADKRVKMSVSYGCRRSFRRSRALPVVDRFGLEHVAVHVLEYDVIVKRLHGDGFEVPVIPRAVYFVNIINL